MTTFTDRIFYGMMLMILTRVGILFIGAVPIVALFGGFPKNSTNIGDMLGSVAYAFIVGIVLYAVLFAYLIHLYA